MRTRLEDDLTRTLTAAATVAPDPDADFAAGVARRQRRNRRTDLTRVAAVVLAVAGLVAVVALRTDAGRRLEVAAVPPVDLATARPATEVWPRAVVPIPDNLPDGRPAWPIGRVDEDRYLMVPSDPSLPYHLPVVLDVRTGEARELFSDPPGSRERTWV